MQLGGLEAVSSPVVSGWRPPKIAFFFTPIPTRNALLFNNYYVCCLQECLPVSSGIVIAIKFGMQFIDKNVRWCAHTMPDLPFFILLGIKSILQNSIYFELYLSYIEYCSILQNKHLVYTESKENIILKFISKKQGWV